METMPLIYSTAMWRASTGHVQIKDMSNDHLINARGWMVLKADVIARLAVDYNLEGMEQGGRDARRFHAERIHDIATQCPRDWIKTTPAFVTMGKQLDRRNRETASQPESKADEVGQRIHDTDWAFRMELIEQEPIDTRPNPGRLMWGSGCF